MNARTPQGTDSEHVIAMLRRAEELTAPSGEELLAMDDAERVRRDAEAEQNYMGAVELIPNIHGLSRKQVQAILNICGTPEALRGLSAECASVGVRFDMFMLFFTGQAAVPPADVKKYKVAGMRGVHYQAGLIREALEKALGET